MAAAASTKNETLLWTLVPLTDEDALFLQELSLSDTRKQVIRNILERLSKAKYQTTGRTHSSLVNLLRSKDAHWIFKVLALACDRLANNKAEHQERQRVATLLNLLAPESKLTKKLTPLINQPKTLLSGASRTALRETISKKPPPKTHKECMNIFDDFVSQVTFQQKKP